MGSSHGFGSTTAYSSPYLDSLSLRLRVYHLTLHTIITRRSMLQKVRRHAKIRAPTTCKHTVSGTVSLPFRGTFHLSLTVLVHYRLLGSIWPWEMVLPDSNGISRVPLYSGSTSKKVPFQLQGYYLLWLAFPGRFV